MAVWDARLPAFALLALVWASLSAGQSIHFLFTDQDCSHNSTISTQCADFYTNELTFAFYDRSYTLELDCRLMREAVACLETSLCHCDFHSQHRQLEMGYRFVMSLAFQYNVVKPCSNQTYGESIFAEGFGPLNLTDGVNCTKYDKTAGDLNLTLSSAEGTGVADLESLCPGVRTCYQEADTQLAWALYSKNWTHYCQSNTAFVDCLVQAACDCDLSTNEVLVELVVKERGVLQDACSMVYGKKDLIEESITCPGVSRCDSQDPMFQCMSDYNADLAASWSTDKYCTAYSRLINCTEGLVCECGFFQDYIYYRQIATAKYGYQVFDCDTVVGPLPNYTGMDCGADSPFTEAERTLSVQLADPAVVLRENASCPGVYDCFAAANLASTQAHMNKNLSEICSSYTLLLTCVEQAYCDCGLLAEEYLYEFLSGYRMYQYDICTGAFELAPPTRCRGLSTCKLPDPMLVCGGELAYDTSLATSPDDQCRASQNHYECVELVACNCGLLEDPRAAVVEQVYNSTTLTLSNYRRQSCANLTGAIEPSDEGITCPGKEPSMLQLTYSNSDDVREMSSTCPLVLGCFRDYDTAKATALMHRSLQEMCRSMTTMLVCVDVALCACGLNGTDMAEAFMADQELPFMTSCQDTGIELFFMTCVPPLVDPLPPTSPGTPEVDPPITPILPPTGTPVVDPPPPPTPGTPDVDPPPPPPTVTPAVESTVVAKTTTARSTTRQKTTQALAETPATTTTSTTTSTKVTSRRTTASPTGVTSNLRYCLSLLTLVVAVSVIMTAT